MKIEIELEDPIAELVTFVATGLGYKDAAEFIKRTVVISISTIAANIQDIDKLRGAMEAMTNIPIYGDILKRDLERLMKHRSEEEQHGKPEPGD